MILDPLGKIWLLDWDEAGFYPTYFEYAAMHNFLVPECGRYQTRIWYLFMFIDARRF